ncbi:Protein of unknown function DUF1468 [Rhabdaerophilaceae bacterium]
MKIHDTILGLVFVLIGTLVLYTVSSFPKMPGQDVGPGMFPGMMAVGLMGFGGLLALKGRTLQGPRHLFTLGEWAGSPRHILAGLSIIMGCASYALFSTALGFLIIAPVLLFIWHLAFGVNVRASLTSAVLTTVITWAVFYKGLGVPLPWGLLKLYAF